MAFTIVSHCIANPTPREQQKFMSCEQKMALITDLFLMVTAVSTIAVLAALTSNGVNPAQLSGIGAAGSHGIYALKVFGATIAAIDMVTLIAHLKHCNNSMTGLKKENNTLSNSLAAAQNENNTLSNSLAAAQNEKTMHLREIENLKLKLSRPKKSVLFPSEDLVKTKELDVKTTSTFGMFLRKALEIAHTQNIYPNSSYAPKLSEEDTQKLLGEADTVKYLWKAKRVCAEFFDFISDDERIELGGPADKCIDLWFDMLSDERKQIGYTLSPTVLHYFKLLHQYITEVSPSSAQDIRICSCILALTEVIWDLSPEEQTAAPSDKDKEVINNIFLTFLTNAEEMAKRENIRIYNNTPLLTREQGFELLEKATSNEGVLEIPRLFEKFIQLLSQNDIIIEKESAAEKCITQWRSKSIPDSKEQQDISWPPTFTEYFDALLHYVQEKKDQTEERDNRICSCMLALVQVIWDLQILLNS